MGKTLEQRFNIVGNSRGLGLRAIALSHLTVGINEELCEIPFDSLGAHDAFGLSLEPVVKRMCVCTIDFNFRKNREG